MSHVTDTILITALADEGVFAERLATINAWLAEAGPGRHRGLVDVDDANLPSRWYGGSKALQCEVAVGAFNYLPIEKFLAFLRTLPWEGSVQLVLEDEHAEAFTLHAIAPVEAWSEERKLRAALEEIAANLDPEQNHRAWEAAQEALGWPMADAATEHTP